MNPPVVMKEDGGRADSPPEEVTWEKLILHVTIISVPPHNQFLKGR